MEKLEDNLSAEAFLMDFSKAFDYIPHKIKVKMASYGIQNESLRLSFSYLNN